MEHNKKQLQQDELLQILPQLLSEGASVPLLISGDSMYPFLKGGRDTVYLSAVTAPLRPGDMVLYRRNGGSMVLHRIIALGESGLCLLGDRQVSREWGVDPASVAATVTAVRRKGKLLRPGHPRWFFFAKLWPKLIPLRPYLIKLYTILAQ